MVLTLSPVTIGVDVGQRHDPTALVVVEQDGDPPEEGYTVRHAGRLPLGTPYPDVARHVAQTITTIRDRDAATYGTAYGPREGPRPIRVVCDATGVGRPVIDLIRLAVGADVLLVAATITGTERLDRRTWQEWSVGKAHLVSRLQALLQTRRLHLPDTAETRQLAQELLDYEIRVQPNTGTLQAGAFGMRHDDLATALGLAVLQPHFAWELIPSPLL